MRNPKMQSCHTLTHALAARKTHLPVKFHAENTPPCHQKGPKWQTFALPFSPLRRTVMVVVRAMVAVRCLCVFIMTNNECETRQN